MCCRRGLARPRHAGTTRTSPPCVMLRGLSSYLKVMILVISPSYLAVLGRQSVAGGAGKVLTEDLSVVLGHSSAKLLEDVVVADDLAWVRIRVEVRVRMLG